MTVSGISAPCEHVQLPISSEWIPFSKEDALSKKDLDMVSIYIAQKVLGEQAVWEFADQHPDVEVATGRLLK